jgi:hypothetical protein
MELNYCFNRHSKGQSVPTEGYLEPFQGQRRKYKLEFEFHFVRPVNR